MTYNYCTLFDSGYLSRGLAMYNSLKKHSKDFHLYIFPFDDKSLTTLKKMKLPNTTIISLKEFEDEELLKVKPTRSKSEYCWTCANSTILYVLNNFNVDNCTYLDADLFFFSDPSVLVKEMEKNKGSVLLTKHDYHSDKPNKCGTYCVQFMTFKKDINGLNVLKWWRERCLEWCYARHEEGKFGDQKYLDDWPERFKGIYVLKNLGGSVAPWNLRNYEIFEKDKSPYIRNKKNQKEFKIVLYHFHHLKFLLKNYVDLGGYKLSRDIIKKIYNPYLNEMKKVNEDLKKIGIDFDPNATLKKLTLKDYLRYFWRKINNRSNIYKVKELID